MSRRTVEPAAARNGPFPGCRVLANNVFWGGLWGIVFALVYNWLPGGWSWLKGLIFGHPGGDPQQLDLPAADQGQRVQLPARRQRLFAGFDGSNPMVLLLSFLILGGFGLGLGIVYGLIARPRNA